jgi:hypothetical protein
MVAPTSRKASGQWMTFGRMRKANVCLVSTLAVVVIISIRNQDPSTLVSDQTALGKMMEEEGRNAHTLLVQNGRNSEVKTPDGTPPPLLMEDASVSLQKANGGAEPQSHRTSVHVAYEKDLAVDYSNHTEFQGTYFEQSPECRPLAVEQVSFTLVTQASLDRLWIMQHHCQRWPAPHPISIAVFLPPDSSQTEDDIANDLDGRWGCDLSRMTVTVLKGTSPMDRYPVNMLRNLAIRSVSTSHFAYTDADFLISDGLYDDLMASAPIVAGDPLAAIVMPAFVYISDCPRLGSNNSESVECLQRERLPHGKEDLLRLWNKRRRALPKVRSGFHGTHFHGSTLYEEFKNQTDPLLLPCIRNYLYEPYLAVRLCKDLPEFPEVFRGYGFNKNVWIMWLTRMLPYKLWQSPQGFVFHIPHQVSESWRRVKNADPVTGKMKKAPREHDAYLKWFKSMPQHPNRIKPCPKSKR